MPEYTVQHKCGMPFMIVSEIDGKAGKSECVPMYYNCPAPCSKMMCKGAIDATADNAKAIVAGGAPPSEQMER